jgi:hypothetical protein
MQYLSLTLKCGVSGPVCNLRRKHFPLSSAALLTYSDGLIDVPVLCSVLTYSSNNQWEAEKINNAHTIGCNSVGWCPTVSNGKRFVV